jgi:hypothetical protein
LAGGRVGGAAAATRGGTGGTARGQVRSPHRPNRGRPTVEELELAWAARKDEIMATQRRDGRRPWAWWAFELGEEQPQERWNPDGGPGGRIEGEGDETVRLAELGELTADELAALSEEANEAKLRIGTDSERISGGWRKYGVSLDQQTVDLWEAVESAMAA